MICCGLKQTEKDLQSHDFTQLVKHARNDEMHYQKIQATFAGLKRHITNQNRINYQKD